jgi:hypothetical protein
MRDSRTLNDANNDFFTSLASQFKKNLIQTYGHMGVAWYIYIHSVGQEKQIGH